METKFSHYDENDLDFMKQYLNDVYTVEKELFCSQQAESRAEYMINSLGHPKNIKVKDSYERPSIGLGIFGAICGFFIALLAGGFVITIISDICFNTSGDWLAFEIQAILLIIVLAIGSILGFKMNYEESSYHAELSKREYMESQQRLKEDNERVEREKALIPVYQKHKVLYSQNIASCQTALNQLYNLNIIFPKYRHFIAISQIYEYYTSGRCAQLEGYEGAYSLLESEIARRIVNLNIEDILNEPEQIEQNQYMLYQAFKEAGARLANLEDDTDASSYNTSVLAENSAICARYSGNSSS